MTLKEIEEMFEEHHKSVLKQYCENVVPKIVKMNDPYVCFYQAYYDSQNNRMIQTPWACMPITKWDSTFEDGELAELDTYEVMMRAKEWGRKYLGAKFPNDENRDGSNVLPFDSPNSSANCVIRIEPYPFQSTKTNE